MKHTHNNYRLGLSALLMLTVGLFFIACKGPEGPAGANGVAACGACHTNSAKLVEKANQYDQSIHAEGLVFEYGNRTACAACHTHEGYMETLKSGLDTVVAMYASPSTIQCRTCHNIHTKYDSTDWKFTNVAPFTTVFDGHKTTIDIGTGNLCAKCHQSRAMSPAIDETKDSVSITSSRWYPHHGGQSNVLYGNTAYDLGVGGVLDGVAGTQAHSKISNTCARCHMAAIPNVEVRGLAGHSFGIATTDPTTGTKTTNVMGCAQGAGETCHTAVDAKFNPANKTTTTDITKGIIAIRTELAKRNWIDTTGSNYPMTNTIKNDLIKATSKQPLKLSKLEAKALVNYFIINQDQSWGVHNPKYVSSIVAQIKAVLGL